MEMRFFFSVFLPHVSKFYVWPTSRQTLHVLLIFLLNGLGYEDEAFNADVAFLVFLVIYKQSQPLA